MDIQRNQTASHRKSQGISEDVNSNTVARGIEGARKFKTNQLQGKNQVKKYNFQIQINNDNNQKYLQDSQTIQNTEQKTQQIKPEHTKRHLQQNKINNRGHNQNNNKISLNNNNNRNQKDIKTSQIKTKQQNIKPAKAGIVSKQKPSIPTQQQWPSPQKQGPKQQKSPAILNNSKSKNPSPSRSKQSPPVTKRTIYKNNSNFGQTGHTDNKSILAVGQDCQQGQDMHGLSNQGSHSPGPTFANNQHKQKNFININKQTAYHPKKNKNSISQQSNNQNIKSVRNNIDSNIILNNKLKIDVKQPSNQQKTTAFKQLQQHKTKTGTAPKNLIQTPTIKTQQKAGTAINTPTNTNKGKNTLKYLNINANTNPCLKKEMHQQQSPYPSPYYISNSNTVSISGDKSGQFEEGDPSSHSRSDHSNGMVNQVSINGVVDPIQNFRENQSKKTFKRGHFHSLSQPKLQTQRISKEQMDIDKQKTQLETPQTQKQKNKLHTFRSIQQQRRSNIINNQTQINIQQSKEFQNGVQVDKQRVFLRSQPKLQKFQQNPLTFSFSNQKLFQSANTNNSCISKDKITPIKVKGNQKNINTIHKEKDINNPSINQNANHNSKSNKRVQQVIIKNPYNSKPNNQPQTLSKCRSNPCLHNNEYLNYDSQQQSSYSPMSRKSNYRQNRDYHPNCQQDCYHNQDQVWNNSCNHYQNMYYNQIQPCTCYKCNLNHYNQFENTGRFKNNIRAHHSPHVRDFQEYNINQPPYDHHISKNQHYNHNPNPNHKYHPIYMQTHAPSHINHPPLKQPSHNFYQQASLANANMHRDRHSSRNSHIGNSSQYQHSRQSSIYQPQPHNIMQLSSIHESHQIYEPYLIQQGENTPFRYQSNYYQPQSNYMPYQYEPANCSNEYCQDCRQQQLYIQNCKYNQMGYVNMHRFNNHGAPIPIYKHAPPLIFGHPGPAYKQQRCNTQGNSDLNHSHSRSTRHNRQYSSITNMNIPQQQYSPNHNRINNYYFNDDLKGRNKWDNRYRSNTILPMNQPAYMHGNGIEDIRYGYGRVQESTIRASNKPNNPSTKSQILQSSPRPKLNPHTKNSLILNPKTSTISNTKSSSVFNDTAVQHIYSSSGNGYGYGYVGGGGGEQRMIGGVGRGQTHQINNLHNYIEHPSTIPTRHSPNLNNLLLLKNRQNNQISIYAEQPQNHGWNDQDKNRHRDGDRDRGAGKYYCEQQIMSMSLPDQLAYSGYGQATVGNPGGCKRVGRHHVVVTNQPNKTAKKGKTNIKISDISQSNENSMQNVIFEEYYHDFVPSDQQQNKESQIKPRKSQMRNNSLMQLQHTFNKYEPSYYNNSYQGQIANQISCQNIHIQLSQLQLQQHQPQVQETEQRILEQSYSQQVNNSNSKILPISNHHHCTTIGNCKNRNHNQNIGNSTSPKRKRQEERLGEAVDEDNRMHISQRESMSVSVCDSGCLRDNVSFYMNMTGNKSKINSYTNSKANSICNSNNNSHSRSHSKSRIKHKPLKSNCHSSNKNSHIEPVIDENDLFINKSNYSCKSNLQHLKQNQIQSSIIKSYRNDYHDRDCDRIVQEDDHRFDKIVVRADVDGHGVSRNHGVLFSETKPYRTYDGSFRVGNIHQGVYCGSYDNDDHYDQRNIIHNDMEQNTSNNIKISKIPMIQSLKMSKQKPSNDKIDDKRNININIVINSNEQQKKRIDGGRDATAKSNKMKNDELRQCIQSQIEEYNQNEDLYSQYKIKNSRSIHNKDSRIININISQGATNPDSQKQRIKSCNPKHAAQQTVPRNLFNSTSSNNPDGASHYTLNTIPMIKQNTCSTYSKSKTNSQVHNQNDNSNENGNENMNQNDNNESANKGNDMQINIRDMDVGGQPRDVLSQSEMSLREEVEYLRKLTYSLYLERQQYLTKINMIQSAQTSIKSNQNSDQPNPKAQIRANITQNFQR